MILTGSTSGLASEADLGNFIWQHYLRVFRRNSGSGNEKWEVALIRITLKCRVANNNKLKSEWRRRWEERSRELPKNCWRALTWMHYGVILQAAPLTRSSTTVQRNATELASSQVDAEIPNRRLSAGNIFTYFFHSGNQVPQRRGIEQFLLIRRIASIVIFILDSILVLILRWFWFLIVAFRWCCKLTSGRASPCFRWISFHIRHRVCVPKRRTLSVFWAINPLLALRDIWPSLHLTGLSDYSGCDSCALKIKSYMRRYTKLECTHLNKLSANLRETWLLNTVPTD